MRYMRIKIVSSERRCDGTLVKRNQKLNLELSNARAHLPRILLRCIVLHMAEATAKCK